ncbi:MAG: hypothetical protein V3T83_22850, partial [Acidobacteriota bacterium]
QCIDFQREMARVERIPLFRKLKQQDFPFPEFSSSGPDIVALGKGEYWAIECKGFNEENRKQTHYNNLDRAVASVVSYYGDLPEDDATLFQALTSRRKPNTKIIALALPAVQPYLDRIEKRVSDALRSALNLWILLYDPTEKSIRAQAPPSE